MSPLRFTGHLLGVALVACVVLIFVAIWAASWHDTATIGGQDVPAIHCEEDEVIAWVGVDTLGCVHYEEVR